MKFIERIKENWNKKDEFCPTCKQVIKPAVGLNKQNLQRLFKKPTLQDWMIFIIIFLALLGGFTYYSEMKQYQKMINDPKDLCEFYYQNIAHGNFGNDRIIPILNITPTPSNNYIPFKK